MVLEQVIIAAKAMGIPVLRNLGGWFEKAFDDGKIEGYELKEGFYTLFRIGILQTLIYFTIPLFGADPNLLASSAAASLVDYLYTKAVKFRSKSTAVKAPKKK